MSYYLINKQPIFLSLSRDKQIRKEALKDKDAEYRVASMIAGTEESIEAQRLMFNVLKAKYDKDPERFYSEWVKFDIVGDEASQNVWDLLYDYCDYHRYAYLSDLRDPVKKIVDDYEGNSYTFPMGRVFVLEHFVKPARWWWKYTHKMSSRTIRLIIPSENVCRLVGDLINFVIFTKGSMMRCGHDFDIFPLL